MRVTALAGTSGVSYHGECLVTEWPDHRRVVVDLGDGTDGVWAAGLSSRTDILVLTHDDDDHIGGAESGLRAVRRGTAGPVKEIWLPADWWFVASALAAAHGVAPAPNADPLTPDDLRSDGPRPRSRPGLHFAEDCEAAHPDAITEWLDHLPDDADLPAGPDHDIRPGIIEALNEFRRSSGHRHGGSRFRGTAAVVAERLARTAHRLLRIIRLAASVSRIRWFTVDTALPEPWRREGRPRTATLVNAEEVHISPLSVASPPGCVVEALCLSVQNRRALVTWLWGGVRTGDRGVVIWSDSGGAGCTRRRVPWSSVAAMTAPHHGSATKDHARIWTWRARHGDDSIGVLLSNNQHSTAPAFNALGPGLGFATHIDRTSGPPPPPCNDAWIRLTVAAHAGNGHHPV